MVRYSPESRHWLSVSGCPFCSIATLFPPRFRKSIERDLQISTAIVFFRWQSTTRDIHLQGS
jgi:hypothetical protein